MDADTEQPAPLSYRAPSRWFRHSKYLVPLNGGRWLGWPEWAPRQSACLADLAAERPDRIELQTVGAAEWLPEYSYNGYEQGQICRRVLPAVRQEAAFVASLRNGRSFGRHCCVMSSEVAVQETAFCVPGVERRHSERLSYLSPRYWRKRWEGDVTSRVWLPPKERIRGSVAVLNTQHSHNFYHWLCDILPRLSPLQKSGAAPDYYLVECLTPFQQRVLAALGIARERLIQPHCRLLLEADELLVPSLPTPECWRHFGQWLAKGLGVKEQSACGRRIYISRRKTGKRSLANEPELQSMLAKFQFETHCMEDYPLSGQAELVRRAELIVAPHGAGLANLMFARTGTQVIEIVPVNRSNAYLFPQMSRILGLHHQQVMAPVVGRAQLLCCPVNDVAAAIAHAIKGNLRSAA
jgi:hypothetical protein